jgi:hypothetical protein
VVGRGAVAAPTCSQTSNVCQATSGSCVNDGPAAYHCSYAAANNGATCGSATNLCLGTGACNAGACVTGNPVNCTAPQQCQPTSGQCKNLFPLPTKAKQVALGSFKGLAMDATGASYVAGNFTSPVTLDATPGLTTLGSQDLVVAKYDPTTQAAVWAVAFGGAVESPVSNQYPNGAAVAGSTVAVIGNTQNGLVVNNAGVAGTQLIAAGGGQDFILGLNSANGSPIFAKGFSIGTGGTLLSIAGNGNRIAVCGFTNAATAPATLVNNGGSNGGLKDVIIAVFDASNGNLVWGKQLGSASDEECDSVTIDDAGNVIAAGKYNRQTATATMLDPGLGQLPDPNGLLAFSNARRHIWVAKYDPTGTPLFQAHFGQGNGNHTPGALTTDASHAIVIGGSFNDVLPFGSTTLNTTLNATGTANSYDAFIAKLNADLTPAWAVSFGGTGSEGVNGIATSSFGEIVAVGNFGSPTMTGTGLSTTLNNFQSAGTTNDAFLVKLDGSGLPQFDQNYGDIAAQTAQRVAINRSGTANVDLVEFAGDGQAAQPPAGTGSFYFYGTDPNTLFNAVTISSWLVFAPLTPMP